MPDEYLTKDEFAALPFAAQCAVWDAHAAGDIKTIPHSGILRYHRAQVLALLAALEPVT